MIHHIVCFRFKPDTPAEAVQQAGAALLAMQGKIPEVRSVWWGPNLAAGVTEYSHVLTVVVDDTAALARYLGHPMHLETVARYIVPLREKRLAIDVEY